MSRKQKSLRAFLRQRVDELEAEIRAFVESEAYMRKKYEKRCERMKAMRELMKTRYGYPVETIDWFDPETGEPL